MQAKPSILIIFTWYIYETIVYGITNAAEEIPEFNALKEKVHKVSSDWQALDQWSGLEGCWRFLISREYTEKKGEFYTSSV